MRAVWKMPAVVQYLVDGYHGTHGDFRDQIQAGSNERNGVEIHQDASGRINLTRRYWLRRRGLWSARSVVAAASVGI